MGRGFSGEEKTPNQELFGGKKSLEWGSGTSHPAVSFFTEGEGMDQERGGTQKDLEKRRSLHRQLRGKN